jgi:hypothetical protein
LIVSINAKNFNSKSILPKNATKFIKIEGGLPALPGTSIVMPVLEGKPMTNGHALEPPAPAAPQLEPTPKHQDPGPPPQEPEQKPELPD